MKSQGFKIQENVPLAPYTTFKIGGPARFFCEVSSEEALLEALRYAKENSLAVFVLGGGSNILVSDKGFDGLVIKVKAKSEKLKVAVQSSKFLVECWSGDSLSSVVRFVADNGLSGLEWAAGIPGSIGGAVRGNAEAFGFSMAINVESVNVIDDSSGDLKIKILNSADCRYSYKNSVFKQDNNLVIVSATLKLAKGDKREIEIKMKEIIKKRSGGSNPNAREPSAGSFFQNPVVTDQKLIERFEKEKGVKCRGNKLPAGWLIDEAGMRGKKIGGAGVSEEHANFVVNLGNAKAQDVVVLVSYIKQKVRDQFGVELKEEIQYVGF